MHDGVLIVLILLFKLSKETRCHAIIATKIKLKFKKSSAKGLPIMGLSSNNF